VERRMNRSVGVYYLSLENEIGRVRLGLEPSLTRPRRARADYTLGPTCPLTRYLLIKPDPLGLESLFFASN
jgi:hypothetical protein